MLIPTKVGTGLLRFSPLAPFAVVNLSCLARLAGFLHGLGAPSAVRVAAFLHDLNSKAAYFTLEDISFLRHLTTSIFQEEQEGCHPFWGLAVNLFHFKKTS